MRLTEEEHEGKKTVLAWFPEEKEVTMEADLEEFEAVDGSKGMIVKDKEGKVVSITIYVK